MTTADIAPRPSTTEPEEGLPAAVHQDHEVEVAADGEEAVHHPTSRSAEVRLDEASAPSDTDPDTNPPSGLVDEIHDGVRRAAHPTPETSGEPRALRFRSPSLSWASVDTRRPASVGISRSTAEDAGLVRRSSPKKATQRTPSHRTPAGRVAHEARLRAGYQRGGGRIAGSGTPMSARRVGGGVAIAALLITGVWMIAQAVPPTAPPVQTDPLELTEVEKPPPEPYVESTRPPQTEVIQRDEPQVPVEIVEDLYPADIPDPVVTNDPRRCDQFAGSGVELMADCVHVVQDGDWLSKLADRYYGDMSLWRAIAARNTVAPKDLKPGMRLYIPPHDGAVAMVQLHDTTPRRARAAVAAPKPVVVAMADTAQLDAPSHAPGLMDGSVDAVDADVADAPVPIIAPDVKIRKLLNGGCRDLADYANTRYTKTSRAMLRKCWEAANSS